MSFLKKGKLMQASPASADMVVAYENWRRWLNEER
jgi:hypothetical protein